MLQNLAIMLDQDQVILSRQVVEQQETNVLLCQLLPQASAAEPAAASAPVNHRGGHSYLHGCPEVRVLDHSSPKPTLYMEALLAQPPLFAALAGLGCRFTLSQHVLHSISRWTVWPYYRSPPVCGVIISTLYYLHLPAWGSSCLPDECPACLPAWRGSIP